ncbi:MAG: SpoIIE family protein phosphatase, partial [Terrimicrobiaceae bacterium]|nr:SpoIIE family protein phosphatase [Terrimicrobiaceae bacterium]
MSDESLRKSLQIYKGLVEVSGLINSITDYGELLRAILDVARRVIRAEAASLFLVDPETGGLELAIATRGETGYIEPRLSVPRGKGIAGWVFEHDEPLLIPDAYQDERFFKEADKITGFVTRSILCAPLKSESRILGVLQVLNPREKPAFEAEDFEGFCAYANLTATAMEKLRTLGKIRAQERVERDLAIAAEIQSEILSRAIPREVHGAVFSAHNTPAANVGGDFYGVFARSPDEICFAIGDVSGKGISAALLMAQTLSAMQFVLTATAGPSAALSRLNETLFANVIRGMFVTTIIARMTPASRRVEIASAGHCLPLL